MTSKGGSPAGAARDDTGGAIVWAVVVEVDHGIGDIARALRRQIAMQLLMTATGQWLTTLHLGEEETFADQLADHCQQLWQAAHGLNHGVVIQQ